MTQSHEHSPQGRVVAALRALALSLIGVAGVATPAAAADYGNVDNTKTGSIIIHKHVQAGSTQSGTPDGSSSTITSAPVSGVIFTAYKLTDLDLTTALGWAGVPSSVPVTACDTPSLAGHTLSGGAASPATDVDGKATISLTAPGAVGAAVRRHDPVLIQRGLAVQRQRLPQERPRQRRQDRRCAGRPRSRFDGVLPRHHRRPQDRSQRELPVLLGAGRDGRPADRGDGSQREGAVDRC